jgi:hypothetical protein
MLFEMAEDKCTFGGMSQFGGNMMPRMQLDATPPPTSNLIVRGTVGRFTSGEPISTTMELSRETDADAFLLARKFRLMNRCTNEFAGHPMHERGSPY